MLTKTNRPSRGRRASSLPSEGSTKRKRRNEEEERPGSILEDDFDFQIETSPSAVGVQKSRELHSPIGQPKFSEQPPAVGVPVVEGQNADSKKEVKHGMRLFSPPVNLERVLD